MALVWDKGPAEDFDGWVFLPWIPGTANSKAERRANWHEDRPFHWPYDREDILKHLKVHSKDDLYFTPNTFLGDSRVAQLTGEERALYADLDEVDPRELDPEIRPTIAWETSPDRFQAIWLLDDFADGSSEPGGLNQRMTAYTGADPSGFDTTQLLRVPGRRNFKFQYKDEESGDSPPGRVLWVESTRHSIAELDRLLPEVKVYASGSEVDDDEIAGVDRLAVWGRVRMKVSHNVREYMSMRSRQINPDQHDRSEILWQIERDLADAGCSVAEIVAIIQPSPWNKHSGRNNEMTQLKSEAAKAIGIAIEEAEEDTLEDKIYDGSRPTLQDLPTLATLSCQRIPRPDWLIHKIWTRGSCGFISGAPKSYKSYLGLDMAISVATGTPFLNDPQFATGKPRKVIYVQEEDSLPLIMHRVGQIIEQKAPDSFWHGQLRLPYVTPDDAPTDAHSVLSDVVTHMPVPVDSLAMLIRKGFVLSDVAWQAWLIEMIGEWGAEMLIIDTLGTTIGDLDADKSGPLNERVLRPLKNISEHTGCAIVIVHHNRKSTTDGRSGQQMLGSVALHAWVESALYVQSKEKLTNNPDSVIKVERENKLAEDMKFRVQIPTMFEERGDQEEGRRQLWEPQVMPGWGDSDATPEPEERRGSTAGRAILAHVVSASRGVDRPVTLDQIRPFAGRQSATSLLKQLAAATDAGLIIGDEDEGWSIA